MRPRSFGISFVVKGESPSFRICVTWGRYVIDHERGIWRRVPYCVLKRISMDEETMKKHTLYESGDGKVLLHVRKVRQNGEYSVIIVSMINDFEIQKCYGESLTGASIFQPSIRIKMDNDTQLAPLDRKGGEILHFLYREKNVLACGPTAIILMNAVNSSHLMSEANLFPFIQIPHRYLSVMMDMGNLPKSLHINFQRCGKRMRLRDTSLLLW
jgi:hypothetical protein